MLEEALYSQPSANQVRHTNPAPRFRSMSIENSRLYFAHNPRRRAESVRLSR